MGMCEKNVTTRQGNKEKVNGINGITPLEPDGLLCVINRKTQHNENHRSTLSPCYPLIHYVKIHIPMRSAVLITGSGGNKVTSSRPLSCHVP